MLQIIVNSIALFSVELLLCFVPNIKAFVPKTTFCIRNELKKGEQKFKCNNKRITATISSSLVDHGSIKIIKGKKSEILRLTIYL